ncbi:MAG TPA: polyprenyl synthetase family protein [Rickettsiales bacterium]|nr:polyprenyl synthetase family protein [Rickettsiales bacterium]
MDTALTHKPTLNRLHALVREDLARVNAIITSNLGEDVPLIPAVAQHIIASGGKRLRPSLTLLSARLCGYRSGERHSQLAASIELIHTATLLHDDVVDESKMRRGKATANELWGNKASVLVGDFLLSRAFQLMVADGSLKALKILSDASAIISRGEVMQLTTANNMETTQAQYLEVITSKTAALFAAACELGAVVSGQTQMEGVLNEIGLCLGIAFQIMDDALDYAANEKTLGKAVGDDFRDGKVTLPVILAYTDGSAEERTFWKRTMEEQDIHDGDLEHATDLIARYDAITRSVAVAENYCETARKLISRFADSEEKEALLETVAFCTQRSY